MKGIMEWCGFYAAYDEIYELLKDGDRFVEIGCLYGDSTIYMAKKIKEGNKMILFYAVDLWAKEGNQEYLYEVFKEGNTVFEDFIDNLRTAGVENIVIPIKSDSSKAAELFVDNSVDGIFFDGNHTYEGLKKDIEAWLPKMKQGAIIAGDDYGHVDSPGVKQAADEYFNVRLIDTTGDYKVWVRA